MHADELLRRHAHVLCVNRVRSLSMYARYLSPKAAADHPCAPCLRNSRLWAVLATGIGPVASGRGDKRAKEATVLVSAADRLRRPGIGACLGCRAHCSRCARTIRLVVRPAESYDRRLRGRLAYAGR